jgi:V/A-type H+-transporting ATPase subunit F
MVGIAVIGNSDFTLGFKLAGIKDTYIEEEREGIESKLNELLTGGIISIVVVQDEDFKTLSPAMKRRATGSVQPVVISVGKLGEDEIRDRIKRAIGIDLYKKDGKSNAREHPAVQVQGE